MTNVCGIKRTISCSVELNSPERQWAEKKCQSCCQSVRERKKKDQTKGSTANGDTVVCVCVKEKSGKC